MKAQARGKYWLYRPSQRIPDTFSVGLFEISEDPQSHALCVREIRKFDGISEDERRRARDTKEGSIDIETPVTQESDQATDGLSPKHIQLPHTRVADLDILKERIKLLGRETSNADEYHGHLVRKRRRYLCMQRALTEKNRVPDNPNFLITLFDDEFISTPQNKGGNMRETGIITSMGGVTIGSRGSQLYVSRVFIERIPEQLQEEEFDLIARSLSYHISKEIKPSVLDYLKLPASKNDFYLVF